MQGLPSKKGRECHITFKQYDNTKGTVSLVESKARFHCWGIRQPKEAGKPKVAFGETVGICELPDGKIRLVIPEKIQFKDIQTQTTQPT